jgi:hypothetical protein
VILCDQLRGRALGDTLWARFTHGRGVLTLWGRVSARARPMRMDLPMLGCATHICVLDGVQD